MTAWIAVLALLSACRTDADPAQPVAVVVDPGELHVATRTLEYGTVPLHDTAQLDLVLSNVGVGTLYIHDLQLGDDRLRPHWTLPDEVEAEIPAGETLLVPIILTPLDVIDASAVLTVLSSDPATPRVQVALNAQVSGVPVLRLEPDSLDFGAVQTGKSSTLDVVLTNLGNDDLVVAGVTLDAAAGFELTIDPTGTTLAPAQSNGLASVTFSPTERGAFTGLMTVASNDPARPEIAVVLVGSGD